MENSEPFEEQSFLTVGEVADKLRLSRMTVYRLIKSGSLPALMLGKSYRVTQHDVQEYLMSANVVPEPENSPEK
ncbi:helix-turn-helix domain-containing protein [Glutamicibacter uratoxydans]|uniref:helix-turn-helix domain-containing protein n=1 Tax=Glutamicibacter uratoxydans TaxID=43667 RepID=UPI001141D09E|nr:helix-turn-helix domain-containing protein [Glutamicibacter uratoxydans]